MYLSTSRSTYLVVRKQECTTTFTIEAEFVAKSEASKEETGINSLLEEIGQKTSGPIQLFCDHEGTIKFYNQEMQRRLVVGEKYRHLILLHKRSPNQPIDTKYQQYELPGATSRYLHEASSCSTFQVSSWPEWCSWCKRSVIGADFLWLAHNRQECGTYAFSLFVSVICCLLVSYVCMSWYATFVVVLFISLRGEQTENVSTRTSRRKGGKKPEGN